MKGTAEIPVVMKDMARSPSPESTEKEKAKRNKAFRFAERVTLGLVR